MYYHSLPGNARHAWIAKRETTRLRLENWIEAAREAELRIARCSVNIYYPYFS